MHSKTINPRSKNGFTLLEVLVAMTIVGISIGIFLGLVGGSSRLMRKVDIHAKHLLLARTKMEEGFLDILGQKYRVRDGERLFEGSTGDGGQWKVIESDQCKKTLNALTEKGTDGTEEMEIPPEGTLLIRTRVEGIQIDTISFSAASEGVGVNSNRVDKDGSE